MEKIIEYNPRYLAYCKSNGNNPDDQLIMDKVNFPGGSTFGFTFWINEKWKEFHNEVIPNESLDYVKCHFIEFDKWLTKKYMNL